jgi:1-acyl-sn-glycerol-3-phosphate acyltransferase
MFYRLAKPFFTLLFKVLTRWEVEGRDNLPSGGPLLVVFNHLGHLDPALLVATLPWRITGLAVAGLREVPVTGFLLRMGGAIWVNRGHYDREALRKALAVLEREGVLVIAPEGRISVTGALERGKTGPVFLAQRANVPILPIGITGTEEAFQKLKRFQRPHLRVIIGRVFSLPERPIGRSRKEQLRADSDFIMRHLAELLPEKYRGVYRELRQCD